VKEASRPDTEHLRVLIANEPTDRLALVASIVIVKEVELEPQVVEGAEPAVEGEEGEAPKEEGEGGGEKEGE